MRMDEEKAVVIRLVTFDIALLLPGKNPLDRLHLDLRAKQIILLALIKPQRYFQTLVAGFERGQRIETGINIRAMRLLPRSCIEAAPSCLST